MNVLAANIRRLRDKAGLTQAQLMEKAGTKALKMIEAGHRGGRVDSLQKIADALGVPLSELFRKPRPARRNTPAP